ncbi:Uncharacterised protein [Bordetella pertussis]|nr:Uncharacterised protein [Bordetella pertussis]
MPPAVSSWTRWNARTSCPPRCATISPGPPARRRSTAIRPPPTRRCRPRCARRSRYRPRQACCSATARTNSST